MRRDRVILVSVLMVLILMLTACGSKKAVTFGPNNTVVVAREINDAVSLDPQVAYEFSSVTAAHNLYSNLVTYEKGDATKPVPGVAEKWEMTPDGLTWSFQLKKGIKFASGNEITAEDVVYTFQRLVNIPKNPAAWLVTDNLGIEPKNVDQQVKALDKYKVQIQLAKPFAPGAFLSIMTFPTTGIVDAQVVKQHVENGDWGFKWLNEHSAGGGPYVLERWERDSQIVMTVNQGYNLGPSPAIKRVILKHTAENTAQLQQLTAGDVDVASSLSAEQLGTLRKDSKYKVLQAPDLALVYLGMDVKNVPAFAKPEVRQAIKYAIDYKAIVDHLLNGNGLGTQGIIPKGMYGYEATAPYSQNVEKAKSLLAQAGFGSGFTVELLVGNGTSSGGIATTDLAAQIKNDLAKVGVTANIRQVASSELYKTYREQKTQMILAQWGADYPDPDNFAKPFGNFGSKSLAYRLQWDDPEEGQLVQKAGTLPNGEERLKLYKQINQIAMERGPFAILYQPMNSLAFTAKLQNMDAVHPVWGIDFSTLIKK